MKFRFRKWTPKRRARHRGWVIRAHRTRECQCGSEIPITKKGNSKRRTKAKYRRQEAEVVEAPDFESGHE